MNRKRIVRLNQILSAAISAGHNIGVYDEHASWFEGEKQATEQAITELESLFNEAVQAGIIHTWTEPGDRYRSTCWDWTTMAHRKAKRRGMTLADPLGNSPLFANVPNNVTTPTEMIRPVSTDALDNDLCGHLNRVYEEQVRYVVSHQGKPVAAVVTLVDLELLKDIQLQVDPCKWLEWVQSLRQRLCWPPVTFDQQEEANAEIQ